MESEVLISQMSLPPLPGGGHLDPRSPCSGSWPLLLTWCWPGAEWDHPPAAGQLGHTRQCSGHQHQHWTRSRVHTSASKSSIRRFVITEKAPTRAFSWLKAATTAFTFKTLLRHYAKRALTPRSLNVKLGPQRNYHKGRAAIRHYANQTARPLWPLRRGPNFTLRDRGVNACLA